jgi:hypothetical protein
MTFSLVRRKSSKGNNTKLCGSWKTWESKRRMYTSSIMPKVKNSNKYED